MAREVTGGDEEGITDTCRVSQQENRKEGVSAVPWDEGATSGRNMVWDLLPGAQKEGGSRARRGGTVRAMKGLEPLQQAARLPHQ